MTGICARPGVGLPMLKTTDRQIDALVVELHGLTKEKIEVVEGRLNHE